MTSQITNMKTWIQKNHKLMSAWWKWNWTYTWKRFSRENELYEKEPDE